MSYSTLSPDTNDDQFKGDSQIKRQRYRHEETVNGTSDWVLLPPGIGDVTVSVSPSAGTARVEFTQDSVLAVDSGTAAGRPWDDLDVAAFTHKTMSNSVTAVRCVSTDDTAFVVTA